MLEKDPLNLGTNFLSPSKLSKLRGIGLNNSHDVACKKDP